ncbi:MAG: regulatory protein RecX [Gemmatimonadales bacterium]
MAVLTGFAPDPRRPGYRLLEVDRGRFASLPAAAVDTLGLGVGAELTAAMLDRLQLLADVEAAYRAALRAQARRPHAVQDLRRRLVQKQHPPAAVDVALERMAAQGLLDDRRFAEHFAATRAGRGRGPARLVKDLLQRGVDRRVAEAAVRSAIAEEGLDPDSTMRAVAERRARQLGDLPPGAKRRRLMAFLSRRGYYGPVVRSVVLDLIGGTPA